jgi:hypothetical protein
VSFKYFLDMAPEDAVIDASSLTKFRKLRLKDMNLLDMLIGKTVEIALACMYARLAIWRFEKRGKERKVSEQTKRTPITSTWKSVRSARSRQGATPKEQRRYKIEAKNSELKHRHGYDVASSSGLLGMELQGAMAIFAVNQADTKAE